MYGYWTARLTVRKSSSSECKSVFSIVFFFLIPNLCEHIQQLLFAMKIWKHLGNFYYHLTNITKRTIWTYVLTCAQWLKYMLQHFMQLYLLNLNIIWEICIKNRKEKFVNAIIFFEDRNIFIVFMHAHTHTKSAINLSKFRTS